MTRGGREEGDERETNARRCFSRLFLYCDAVPEMSFDPEQTD